VRRIACRSPLFTARPHVTIHRGLTISRRDPPRINGHPPVAECDSTDRGSTCLRRQTRYRFSSSLKNPFFFFCILYDWTDRSVTSRIEDGACTTGSQRALIFYARAVPIDRLAPQSTDDWQKTPAGITKRAALPTSNSKGPTIRVGWQPLGLAQLVASALGSDSESPGCLRKARRGFEVVEHRFSSGRAAQFTAQLP